MDEDAILAYGEACAERGSEEARHKITVRIDKGRSFPKIETEYTPADKSRIAAELLEEYNG